ncbi:vitamin H transporter protein [Rutstroemia sp. NJR-2017a BVV2]|nr:vitamin H transporter protein [Rutstroemia sp. NJR-2017a BVV2]PQE25189.1 vitamin H transporter protein [Rutstroemia sp. NJR-2017a BVV2]
MILRLFMLIFATLISIVVSVSTSSSKDLAVGISLGLDYITSAYITETDDFVTVARVESIQDWKNFYYSLLKMGRGYKRGPREYKDSQVNELLAKTFLSIKEATETKLNQQVEILSITYPFCISDQGYRSNLFEAATEVLPGMKDITQFWMYFHSIRQAYKLNTAEALGYPAGTNIDHQDSMLLHIDYQDSLLDVAATDILGDFTGVTSSFQIFDFGNGKQAASPAQLETFKLRLRKLIDGELAPPTNAGHLPAQLEDFRYVIFSGTAPQSEFQKLRESIIEAVPEFSDRFIKDSIDPEWVGAVGAARRAKVYQVEGPPSWDHWEYVIHDETKHNEL